MASASTTANSELPRQSSICSLSTFLADLQTHNNHHRSAVDDDADDDGDGAGDQATTMDDLLNNIYSESPQPPQMEQSQNPEEPPFSAAAAAAAVVGVDEVWKRIVAGGGDRRAGAEGGAGDGGAMTLEDFLTKSGAVREEDVRVPVGGGGFGQFQGGPMVVYGGNGSGATAPAGRGKRRAVEEPMDKATQQKQRRMIKNRESAARSRERKQAYTVELESLVTQLEEENARLLREEAERKKERYKQLMENLVPVVERKEKIIMEKFHPESNRQGEKIRENIVPESRKNRTLSVLRRVYSTEW